jgi:hypothetical protein
MLKELEKTEGTAEYAEYTEKNDISEISPGSFIPFPHISRGLRLNVFCRGEAWGESGESGCLFPQRG